MSLGQDLMSAVAGGMASLAILSGLSFVSAPAQAQEKGDDREIEEIVVTGSRIKRRDFTSPSPITTLDREALLNSGQPTLEASLNQMPHVTPDFDRTANNPGNGTARLNLRGLGSGRTLVLLNGRRLAPSGVGSSVDVNNLPQALVDRVEIITGGASTVYGSDAVAGVINFITRRDLDGFSLGAGAYTTEAGDSEIYDLNAFFGHDFDNGRGNITLTGAWLERKPSFAADRALTAVPLADVNGELVQRGSTATPAGVILGPPADLGDGPVRVTFTPDGLPVEFRDPEDRYNFAPVNYLQTPLERISGSLFLNLDLTDRLESYAEITHTRSNARRNLAPVPLFSVLATNPDNPVLTPEAQQVFANDFIPADPGIVFYFLGKRLQDLGPRIIEDTSDYSRLVAGLRGDINDNWEFDAWATYTRTVEETLNINDASRSRVQQGLLVDPGSGECFDPSDACVPVDLFGEGRLSAEAINFIRLPHLANDTKRTQKLVSAFVRGRLFDTWAGPVESAFGIEWRSDDGSFTADDALFTGDALGFSGEASIDGSESVYEVYAEALVPLARNSALAEMLMLEIGARHSVYDHAGSVNTYKAGGEWQLVAALRLRGMFQRSVRAPTIAEAFEERFTETLAFVGATPEEDLCTASADPIGNGLLDECIATGLPADQVGVFEATVGFPSTFIHGGNTELVPEKADTVTMGVVFTPHEALQISVDYFDLQVDDTIEELISSVACFDPANTENLFCDTIRRDPVTFDVNELFEINVNRGARHTRGIDTQLKYSTDVPSLPWPAGDLSVNLIWTHLLENTIQGIAGGTELDCKGGFGFPCNSATDGMTFPDNRVTTNLSLRSGALSALLTWRWIEGSDNAAPRQAAFFGLPAPTPAITDVGSRSYLDLGLAYHFSEHFVTRFGITNLFDTDAPLMANAVRSNNTDTRLYDVFGRSYALSIAWRSQ